MYFSIASMKLNLNVLTILFKFNPRVVTTYYLDFKPKILKYGRLTKYGVFYILFMEFTSFNSN